MKNLQQQCLYPYLLLVVGNKAVINLNEAQIIGYIVMAVVTLGGFITVILKMTQPINDLRIVIQELKDCIKSIKEDNLSQNKRLDKHGEKIDKLNNRVEKIETQIKIYHEQ